MNKDSISIFVSQTDSINLILAPPNQLLPTFGRLQAWSDLSIGPYLVCGSLITYSAIDKFKTSYLYYSNNPIPDTLFVDYKTINNHKGWRGYDYIPDSVSLNNIKGTQTNQFGNWIFVKK
ncbi:MAG: hypothetical protein Q8M15_16300 [Bacteroidota bacterium]|nr:hypothetical protein [Bacteroidota bacterium]